MKVTKSDKMEVKEIGEVVEIEESRLKKRKRPVRRWDVARRAAEAAEREAEAS